MRKKPKNSRENSKLKKKNSKLKKKTQNSRKKLKAQGKNSMSRRIAPLLTSQVMLKKSHQLHPPPCKSIKYPEMCFRCNSQFFVWVNLLGNDKFCWMRRRRSKACRLGLTSYHRWPTLLGWGLWRCRCGKSPDNRATLGISDVATSLGTFVQICNQAQSI